MSGKRILLVTQYFQPENFKCNDIAFEMQRRGYDVTVLTAIPNYISLIVLGIVMLFIVEP